MECTVARSDVTAPGRRPMEAMDGEKRGGKKGEAKREEVDTDRNDSHTFHAAGRWRHRSFSNFCARHRGWHTGSRWFQEGLARPPVVGTEKIGEKELPASRQPPHTPPRIPSPYARTTACQTARGHVTTLFCQCQRSNFRGRKRITRRTDALRGRNWNGLGDQSTAKRFVRDSDAFRIIRARGNERSSGPLIARSAFLSWNWNWQCIGFRVS